MSYTLQFLGSGSAFTNPQKDKNYQSNMILTTKSGKKLLIDCGTQCHQALDTANIVFSEIDAVYISHLHADHIGGLEELAFKTYFSGQKMTLFAEESLTNDLWEHSLKGGLSFINGKKMNFDDYFNINPVLCDFPFFYYDGLCLIPHKSKHFKINEKEYSYSYSLLIIDKFHKVFISTDQMFESTLEFLPIYKNANLIFQDCETGACKSGVHAHFDELKTLPDEIKQKMILYHYKFPPEALKFGFKGFAKRGDFFIIN
jgi:hypothetical protein